MALAPPRSLHFDIHLGWEVHVHPGGGSQGKSDVKKKPDNWPEDEKVVYSKAETIWVTYIDEDGTVYKEKT